MKYCVFGMLDHPITVRFTQSRDNLKKIDSVGCHKITHQRFTSTQMPNMICSPPIDTNVETDHCKREYLFDAYPSKIEW